MKAAEEPNLIWLGCAAGWPGPFRKDDGSTRPPRQPCVCVHTLYTARHVYAQCMGAQELRWGGEENMGPGGDGGGASPGPCHPGFILVLPVCHLLSVTSSTPQ